MNNRKVAACLLAVAVLFAVVPTLSASDPRKSHRPIGSAEGIDENELARRLQPTQDRSVLRTLAEKMLKNPEKFPKLTQQHKDLLEQLLKDQNTRDLLNKSEMMDLFRDAMKNPKLSDEQLKQLREQFDDIPPKIRQKLLDEARKNPADHNLSDKDLDALTKLVEHAKTSLTREDRIKWAEILNKIRQNPNLPPDDLDAIKRTLPPGPGPDLADRNAGEDPMNPSAGPAVPPMQLLDPPPPPAHGEDAASQWLATVADFFQDLDPDNEFLGNLAGVLRDAANDDTGSAKWAKGAISTTVDWIGTMNAGDWLPSEQTRQTAGSWFSRFRAPSVPRMDGPSSVPSLPSSGGLPSGTSTLEMDDLVRVLVWGAVLAILGYAGWRLLLWYRGDNVGGNGRPAGWPVRPGAVATRGDLVRAFEYLALLLLGVDARHRHHLDLAKRLGESSPKPNDARRHAADQLAHLYELARYAPEDELLAEAELAAARRDLSYLAGAGAA